MGRRKNPRYSPEFKAEAIRLVRTTSDSIPEIARQLGVTDRSLYTWVAETRPEPTPALTTDERTELQQLRREVRQLREERDILKKWSCTAAAHPRRDESGSVGGASAPGQGRRLLVLRARKKMDPSAASLAPRTVARASQEVAEHAR
jgi:transposase